MTLDEFPASPPPRPLWLVTLADLSLLLVGFFVLLQANQTLDHRALADGLREGFGAPPAAAPAAPAAAPAPMPVAAIGAGGFLPGSATLHDDPQPLAAWARDAVRDPRVELRVTGTTDGTSRDVDPMTGSAAILAADRARVVAAIIAPLAPGRITIMTAPASGRRNAVVTLAFAGERNQP